MQIKKVGIIGLGAIGVVMAAQLYEKDPNIVYVIADNNRVERYKKEGIYLNNKKYDFNYVIPQQHLEPMDLIIVAVKYYDLNKAIIDMKNYIKEDTIILSLMNGVSTEEEIGKIYGNEKMLYSFIVETSIVRNNRRIDAKQLGKIVFNTKDNISDDKRVIAIKNLFDLANIKYEIAENILHEIWWKFMINVGINQTSAIINAKYGDFQRFEETREIMNEAMKEIINLSKYEGINLGKEDLLKWEHVLNKLHPEGMTSMLQDVLAGRKTEVEMFSGVVCKLCEKHKIEAPINNLLYNIIKSKEKISNVLS